MQLKKSMNKFGDNTFNGYVDKAWLDHNDHMNLGYYLIVFDRGTSGFYSRLNIGLSGKSTPDDSSKNTKFESMFTVEARVIYSKELLLDEQFHIETRILGYDHNKVHYMHWMIEDRTNEVCAINELIAVNVSMDTRKAVSFKANILSGLLALAKEHHNYPVPDQAGGMVRQIGYPTSLE